MTRPMYRPDPAVRKRLTMGAGAVTQSFFAKGEEQEATGYQDVILDDAGTGSPDLGFDSFDKIPRRRRPLIVVAGFLSLLVAGFLAWKAVRGPARGSSIAVAARAMVGDHEPAPPPAPAPSQLTVMPSPAAVVPTAASPEAPPASAVPTEVAPNRPIKIAERAAETENHAARSARTAGSEPTAANDRPSERAVTGSRPAPLRGYVWSPEANGLVPAQGATADPAQDPATTPQPSAAPAAEFGIAPSRTAPSPVETRRAPTESAPIVE